MTTVQESGDYLPTALWDALRLRAELLRRVRRFFDEREFLEVETPILSADTVVDRHLDPFSVDACAQGDSPIFVDTKIGTVPGDPTPGERRWLQTSPEFAMKRLLAAGGRAIYQVAKVFRRDELGPLHNPEFTMVEWYRAGDGMHEGMALLGELAATLLGRGPTTTTSYGDAFRRYAGLDPHTAGAKELAAATRLLGLTVPESLTMDDRDGWLDLLMAECVAPKLGLEHPEIVFDYPASQAALARVRQDDPPVAERFELFVSGIELANGYHELLDPAELRKRNAQNNALRQADGKPPLPAESRLLAAMDHGLPASTGVALGFDRVVMLAAGASRLDEVIAFPFDRA